MPKIREQPVQKQVAVGAERRRTKRIPISFHIEISGRDTTGAPFTDRAMTSDVNENGCKFNLLWELKPGDLVSIRIIPKDPNSPNTEQPTIFKIVWTEPSHLGWTVGASTLRAKNIWHMAFPTKE